MHRFNTTKNIFVLKCSRHGEGLVLEKYLTASGQDISAPFLKLIFPVSNYSCLKCDSFRRLIPSFSPVIPVISAAVLSLPGSVIVAPLPAELVSASAVVLVIAVGHGVSARTSIRKAFLWKRGDKCVFYLLQIVSRFHNASHECIQISHFYHNTYFC